MKNKRKNLIIASIGIAALVASTALATAYFTRTLPPTAEAAVRPVQRVEIIEHRTVAAAEPVQPDCDDGNLLGYVAGAAVGGIAGNQVGKGSGNTAATIAGTLGGAYLGGKHIPLKNVTCR